MLGSCSPMQAIPVDPTGGGDVQARDVTADSVPITPETSEGMVAAAGLLSEAIADESNNIAAEIALAATLGGAYGLLGVSAFELDSDVALLRSMARAGQDVAEVALRGLPEVGELSHVVQLPGPASIVEFFREGVTLDPVNVAEVLAEQADLVEAPQELATGEGPGLRRFVKLTGLALDVAEDVIGEVLPGGETGEGDVATGEDSLLGHAAKAIGREVVSELIEAAFDQGCDDACQEEEGTKPPPVTFVQEERSGRTEREQDQEQGSTQVLDSRGEIQPALVDRDLEIARELETIRTTELVLSESGIDRHERVDEVVKSERRIVVGEAVNEAA